MTKARDLADLATKATIVATTTNIQDVVIEDVMESK